MWVLKHFFSRLEYTAELPQFKIPNQVLVITPEKALLLLKREPIRFETCALVVLDECHMLGSGDRGDIAETVLASCVAQNLAVRIILMSALVQDGDKLAKWLEGSTGKSAATGCIALAANAHDSRDSSSRLGDSS